jgi:hypothetical protein
MWQATTETKDSLTSIPPSKDTSTYSTLRQFCGTCHCDRLRVHFFWVLVSYCRASLHSFYLLSSSFESLNSTNPSWRLSEFTIQNAASKSINNESSDFQARYLSCHKVLCNWREVERERKRRSILYQTGRERESIGQRIDVTHMSVSNLALFIVPVSTARLFDMSVND